MNRETERVAVVGAGAAGLVTARELGRRGWRHVTVFEAGGEPGGRTRSVAPPGSVGLELGTQYMLKGPVLDELLRETGLDAELVPWPQARLRRLDGSRPFHPFAPDRADPLLLRRGLAAARLLRALKRHGGLEAPGFRGLPGSGLSASIDAFFARERLGPLRGSLMPLTATLLGGNAVGIVPAAYLVKFELLRLRMPTIGNLMLTAPRVKGGNQELWRRVARGIDVRLQTPVRSLRREGGAWQVGEERFDRVVWTGALPELDRLLGGGRPWHDRVRTLHRAILAYRVEGLPPDFVWLLPEVIAGRGTSAPYSMCRWAGADVIAFFPWQTGPALPDYEPAIRALVEGFGGRLGEPVMEPATWAYAPYFDGEAVEAGAFDAIEATQGQDGIYIAGEALSGITLPAVSEYARDLVRRYF